MQWARRYGLSIRPYRPPAVNRAIMAQFLRSGLLGVLVGLPKSSYVQCEKFQVAICVVLLAHGVFCMCARVYARPRDTLWECVVTALASAAMLSRLLGYSTIEQDSSAVAFRQAQGLLLGAVGATLIKIAIDIACWVYVASWASVPWAAGPWVGRREALQRRVEERAAAAAETAELLGSIDASDTSGPQTAGSDGAATPSGGRRVRAATLGPPTGLGGEAAAGAGALPGLLGLRAAQTPSGGRRSSHAGVRLSPLPASDSDSASDLPCQERPRHSLSAGELKRTVAGAHPGGAGAGQPLHPPRRGSRARSPPAPALGLDKPAPRVPNLWRRGRRGTTSQVPLSPRPAAPTTPEEPAPLVRGTPRRRTGGGRGRALGSTARAPGESAGSPVARQPSTVSESREPTEAARAAKAALAEQAGARRRARAGLRHPRRKSLAGTPPPRRFSAATARGSPTPLFVGESAATLM
eukprot:TRINITY_DN37430_c0_g1_i2.p1 TRINITY_DN37430_c0_g1~~TRINITY_DN37430_c0_g1_i2.p1  ORF type:complete len:467 (+),score=70.63 TRINITY_DN37430_c0_g1_i2:836-2236(+)